MREYLSFGCWCVEVVDIPYYNFLTEYEQELLEEQYIEYCTKHNLECDIE